MNPGPSTPESASPATADLAGDSGAGAVLVADGPALAAGEPRAAVAARPAVAHLAGLDGLRAIAVLSVVFYHLNLSGFFPGGFLGVDIFFTLSGFLITSLLLREQEGRGGIDLKGFYLRRFRRLAPAVLAVIGVCAVLLHVVAEDAAPQLRKDIPAALFYVSNWWQVVSEQSYFEMMSRPPLLQHLWSLAIEEQFYLLWPLLLMAVMARAGRRGLLRVSLGLTLLTAGWMAWLAVQGNIPLEADPNRLYLGTDTHTTGLFAGALLACLWNPWRPAGLALPGGVAAALGAVGLAALMAMFLWANETQDWLYRGGFLLVAVMTVAAIMGATAPGSALARGLGTPLMRYLGERSYGLYLWHWPVFVLLRPQDLALPVAATEVLRLVVTFLAAELSFRYVEDPLRSGRLLAWNRRQQAALLLAAGVGVGAVVSLYVQGYTNPPAAQVPDYLGERLPDGVSTRPAAVTNTMLGVSPVTPCATCPATGAVVEESFSGGAAGPVDMLAIGDSVMLGAKHYFLRGLPGAWVDAQVGRQGRDALRIVRALRAKDRLPSMVLIHLGTNGYLPESLFRKLVAELADRDKVILVNVQASRRWVADNNTLLAELGKSQANVVVLDWATLSEGHPEYFVADGIHLTGAGIRAYVGAIRQASGVTGAFVAAGKVVDALPATGPVASTAGATPSPEGAVTPLSVPAESAATAAPAAATDATAGHAAPARAELPAATGPAPARTENAGGTGKGEEAAVGAETAAAVEAPATTTGIVAPADPVAAP